MPRLNTLKDLDRFIFPEPNSGCWIWTGYGERYGVFNIYGKQFLAHRFVYELEKGPIPEGLTIDHLCRTTHCVNPRHLEAVTMQVNTLRGVSIVAQNAKKTHCKNGHLLEGKNLFISKDGSRHCRTCKKNYYATPEWREYFKQATRRYRGKTKGGNDDVESLSST